MPDWFNGDEHDDQQHQQPNHNKTAPSIASVTEELTIRVTQLERIVAEQEVELLKLRKECKDLNEAAAVFARVVEVLREAGVSARKTKPKKNSLKPVVGKRPVKKASISREERERTVEYFDTEIFGTAPTSVTEAADGAGAAVLAGLLGGKHRMLVDVRDASLSNDSETLTQFVELAILPVAAGIQGIKSQRNRVKIVFPTLSHLLDYRKSMVLASPEVIALSTLDFEPVEKRDNLVVIVAPPPDNEEALAMMNNLLQPKDPKKIIRQPVVVINHHMVPISGPATEFEVAYHLRLLSVQYMSDANAPDYLRDYGARIQARDESLDDDIAEEEDEALEAAMKHAHEIGMNQGMTRAMVIRAYPKPWHVFVDTSPDTDADFEIAATFDDEPSQLDVNYAIVECLEGSENEDELVAQQMQLALEAGQLDQVADMLPPRANTPSKWEDENDENDKSKNIEDDEGDKDDDDDIFYNDFDFFEEDSC